MKQIRIDVIYDCEDSTVSTYFDYKIEKVKGLDGKKSKWLPAKNLPMNPRYITFKYDELMRKNANFEIYVMEISK